MQRLTPAPRAVLYDLDGVLIDSAEAWYLVIQRGRREAGLPPVDEVHFRRTFGQGVIADRDEFFPAWAPAQVEELYARAFPDELGAVRLLDDAPAVLAEVRARGLRQAIVTNTPLGLARRVLAAKGLDRHLDALACAGEAAEKPAPDLVWLALRRLGVTREEVVYLGDTRTDEGAARAAGVRLLGMRMAGDLTLARLGELLELV